MQGFFIVMPASEKVPLVIIVGPLLLAEMHDRGMITRGWQQARTHTLQKTAIFRRTDSFQGAQNRALVGAPQLCTHMRSGQRTESVLCTGQLACDHILPDSNAALRPCEHESAAAVSQLYLSGIIYSTAASRCLLSARQNFYKTAQARYRQSDNTDI